MGYSCTAFANTVERQISNMCYEQSGMQNVWKNKGKEYFYEIGCEQSDGSITGTVFLLEEDDGKKLAYRKGSIKIDPSGNIVRFPNLPKEFKERTNPDAV